MSHKSDTNGVMTRPKLDGPVSEGGLENSRSILNNFVTSKLASPLRKRKADFQSDSLTRAKIKFHFNLFQLALISMCPCVSWRSLSLKRYLLMKGKEKLFFQLDILNYLKKMQLLDLLGYILLDADENIIIQFLSKPSISLAQRTDIYERINKINNVDTTEINELYSAIQRLTNNQNKTDIQKRLFHLTRSEMGLWIKRMKDL